MRRRVFIIAGHVRRRVYIVGQQFPLWLLVVLLIFSALGVALGALIGSAVGAPAYPTPVPGGGLYGHKPVVGDVNVDTGRAGLFVNEPLVDILKHTPNDASEDLDDASIAEDPVTAWPVGAVITDHSNIDFSDDVYETTTASAIANYAQQVYRFYVGDAANITKIVLSWEGKVSVAGATNVQVWNGTTSLWDTTMQQTPSTTEGTLTITLTNSTAVTVSNAVVNGSVYLQVFPLGVGPATVSTDYTTATVTYTAINWTTWTGFRGTEIMKRKFVVPKRWIGVHKDDQLGFEAAAELKVGDWWMFILPIKNSGSSDITARLTLQVPEALNVYVMSADQVGDYDPRILKATLIGNNVWKFKVKSTAVKLDDDDYLYVMVNAHADGIPGMFRIDGILEQIPF